MATVTIVLRTDRINKNGEAPINFLVIKNRRITKVSTGILVNPKYWDNKKCKVKKGLKNSARVNSFLSKKFSELQDHVLDQETNHKSLTSKQLKRRIYGNTPTDFFVFAKESNDSFLKEKKIGSYRKNKAILNKTLKFTDRDSLFLQEIDLAFLNRYENYLREVLHNKTNTIGKDMKFIRKIFNEAIRNDKIEASENPFLKYKIKTEKTHRAYLSEEELSRFEEMGTHKSKKVTMHCDMYVFACYAGGLRVSDILQLKWKNFDGENINFTIRKTKQQISVKLPDKALEIIQKYYPQAHSLNDFIFPILKKEIDLEDPAASDRAISSATAEINKNLKKIANLLDIDKKISFHTSRHTWATRALKKGMRIEYVSKLMGHSTIRETQMYAKIVNEELDKAMEIFNT